MEALFARSALRRRLPRRGRAARACPRRPRPTQHARSLRYASSRRSRPEPGRASRRPARGRIWVSNFNAWTLARVESENESRSSVARIKVGKQPCGLAFGAGSVWVGPVRHAHRRAGSSDDRQGRDADRHRRDAVRRRVPRREPVGDERQRRRGRPGRSAHEPRRRSHRDRRHAGEPDGRVRLALGRLRDRDDRVSHRHRQQHRHAGRDRRRRTRLGRARRGRALGRRTRGATPSPRSTPNPESPGSP